MKFELKNIHLWPVFKITFFVSTSIMLIILLLFGNQYISMLQSMSQFSNVDIGSINVGFFSFIFIAIAFGLNLAILATVFCVLYNLFSQWFGGYVVEFEGDWEVIDENEENKKIEKSKDKENDSEAK
jgi:hypothetical protein